MKNFQKIIVNKKINQFKDKNINVDADDILNFLDNVFFKHNEKNKKTLKYFLENDNIEEIVNYLMSNALINPKF